MNQYVLFLGNQYYPQGGWWDFMGSFGSLLDAGDAGYRLLTTNKADWGHIVDTRVGKVVLKWNPGSWEKPEENDNDGQSE